VARAERRLQLFVVDRVVVVRAFRLDVIEAVLAKPYTVEELLARLSVLSLNHPGRGTS